MSKQEEKKITKEMYLLAFKAFWRNAAPARQKFWYILIGSSIIGVASTYVQLLSGKIVDALTIKDLNTVVLWIGTVSIVLVIQTLVNKVITFQRARFGSAVYRYYEAELYKKLLKTSSGFIKTKNLGKLTTIINRGLFAIDSMGSNFLMNLLAPLFSAIVALATIFVISWQYGLITIAGLCCYSISVYYYTPKAVSAQRNLREQAKTYSEYVSDLVSNLFSVKQNSQESFEVVNIDSHYNKNANLADKLVALNSDMIYWQGFFRDLTQICFWILGSWFIFKTTDYKVGTIIALIGMYNQVFSPIDAIASRWKSFVNAFTDLEESENLFNEPEENYNEEGLAIDEAAPQLPLVLENVSFSYPDAPDVPVLKNISLTINPCEVIALVSTSGGGKSTLFDLLYQLYTPTSGSIHYGNHAITDFKLRDYRKQFAIVPQDISLFNTTLKQNIMYGSDGVTDEQLEKVLRETSMDGFVAKLPEGLETIVGDKGMKLSGGQKQRVAICRSFLRNPKILLMDEPTSALDSETEQVIQTALSDLFVGKTVIVAAHRLATIKKANRIVVLKEGEIIEIGSHEELLKKKNGEYKKLYELQVGLY